MSAEFSERENVPEILFRRKFYVDNFLMEERIGKCLGDCPAWVTMKNYKSACTNYDLCHPG